MLAKGQAFLLSLYLSVVRVLFIIFMIVSLKVFHLQLKSLFDSISLQFTELMSFLYISGW